MFKWPFIVVLTVVAVLITVLFLLPGDDVVPQRSENQSQDVGSEISQNDQAGALSLPLSDSITPPTFNQDIAFTSQAPFAVWDHLHNESCEEASLLIAYAWAHGLILDPVSADAELKKIADWEVGKFGFFESTTAEQTAQVAREFYQLKVDLRKNPTVEQIKRELIGGNLVVMGMAGRWLDNPHFKPPGPIYHMLVIKGYDETGFFTNDPGTLYGKNYHYSYAKITKAAHDWTGVDEEIYTSPAVALIVSK